MDLKCQTFLYMSPLEKRTNSSKSRKCCAAEKKTTAWKQHVRSYKILAVITSIFLIQNNFKRTCVYLGGLLHFLLNYGCLLGTDAFVQLCKGKKKMATKIGPNPKYVHQVASKITAPFRILVAKKQNYPRFRFQPKEPCFLINSS